MYYLAMEACHKAATCMSLSARFVVISDYTAPNDRMISE